MFLQHFHSVKVAEKRKRVGGSGQNNQEAPKTWSVDMVHSSRDATDACMYRDHPKPRGDVTTADSLGGGSDASWDYCTDDWII